MELNLATPALLFSAISLLLLAYTNRFIALASLVRNLHAKYHETPDHSIFGQIENIRKRINMIRNMQIFGITSLLLCVLCMFLIYINLSILAEIIFGISLVLLILSLALSIREIQISVHALNIHLSDLEDIREKEKNN
ncbi:DUF2721 domain-containing protein [Bacteroidota bacterium]